MMTQTERLHFLISYMLQEQGIDKKIPESFEERYSMYRGLANEREARAISQEYLHVQDSFLQEENEKNITLFDDLVPVKDNLYLWQGDITHLKIDGIVNAANSELLGCFIPNHNCIDNIIHTKAGLQLRLACKKIMDEQKRKEAVGRAKVTKAYNLPSNYVIHTVGPVVKNNHVSLMKRDLLQKCYRASLEKAEEYGMTELAFCSISTGVFGYPKKEAATAAIEAVRDYIDETKSEIKVVFNVFTDEDYDIYQELLA